MRAVRTVLSVHTVYTVHTLYSVNKFIQILYVVDKSDMPVKLMQSVLSPSVLKHPMMDSFSSSGNSLLFQTKLIILWISQQIS